MVLLNPVNVLIKPYLQAISRIAGDNRTAWAVSDLNARGKPSTMVSARKHVDTVFHADQMQVRMSPHAWRPTSVKICQKIQSSDNTQAFKNINGRLMMIPGIDKPISV